MKKGGAKPGTKKQRKEGKKRKRAFLKSRVTRYQRGKGKSVATGREKKNHGATPVLEEQMRQDSEIRPEKKGGP